MKTKIAVTIIIKDRSAVGHGGGDKTTLDVDVEYNAERGMWQHRPENGVLTYGESAHGLAARIAAETVAMLQA
jgi:hypothetical protein